MAQKKGKWGGSRPGAGPPRKGKQVPTSVADRDMLTLLQDVALGRIWATPLQVRAAIAAVQYTHTKKADGGKKEEQADKAQKAASKFTQTAAPLKLVRP